ncbi:hypothetical protein HDU76_001079 [Blyttiomyces sp. JEL0837]|nr:hypothetical protein HDU76_001079 [Blyttiomyces sp. JEL0837]
MDGSETVPPYEMILHMAQEQKDPHACILLATFFSAAPVGEGRNITKALHFYQEAGRNGSIDGAKKAAMMLRSDTSRKDGVGDKDDEGEDSIPRNGMEARKWMRMAAEMGDPAGWLTLGNWYWTAYDDDTSDESHEFDDSIFADASSTDPTDTYTDPDIDTELEKELNLPPPTSTKNLYQRKAIYSWFQGTQDPHKNADCMKRLSDYFVSISRMDLAVNYWEMAARMADGEAVKNLAHYHAKLTLEMERNGGSEGKAGGRGFKGGSKKRGRGVKKLIKGKDVGVEKDDGGCSAREKYADDDDFRAAVKRAKTEVKSDSNEESNEQEKEHDQNQDEDETNDPVLAMIKESQNAGDPPGVIAAKFLKYAKQAVQDGDAVSMLALAMALANGVYVPKIRSAIANSTTKKSSPFDMDLDMANDDDKADPLVRLQRTSCNPADGILIPSDPTTAVQLYMDAFHIAGGPPSSLAAAADLLFRGVPKHGLERNVSRAIDLYVQAAREGHSAPAFLVSVGDALRSGEGCEDGNPNLERAFEVYVEAEDHGENEALVRLGDCWRFGIGTPDGVVDLVKGFAYYERSAEAGEKMGMSMLAQCLMIGEGCEIDIQRARLLIEAVGDGQS